MYIIVLSSHEATRGFCPPNLETNLAQISSCSENVCYSCILLQTKLPFAKKPFFTGCKLRCAGLGLYYIETAWWDMLRVVLHAVVTVAITISVASARSKLYRRSRIMTGAYRLYTYAYRHDAVQRCRRARNSSSYDTIGWFYMQRLHRTVGTDAANLAPRHTAGCCHLANLIALSQYNCPSSLKVSERNRFPD